MKKTCIVIVVAKVMCFLATAATSIEGRMDVTWPAADPPILRHYSFSCFVQQQGWQIATRQDDDQTAGHRERGKDGTNFFFVHYVNPPITTNQTMRVVRALGKISRDDENALPYFTDDFTHVLWLAYCRQLRSSHEFQDSAISSRMLYGDNMPATNFPCTATWKAGDTFALEKLVVSHPGVVYGMSGIGYPLSGSLATGYVGGHFEGKEFTNVGNAFFPQSASWSFFSATKADAAELETLHHVEVRATSITSVPDKKDIRPEVSVLMSVNDYRFAALAGKGETYITSDGWWAPSDKKFIDTVGRIKFAKEQRGIVPLNRKLAIVAFLLVVGVPTLLIGLRFRKNPGKNQTPDAVN
jgi:hypothetical protein